MVNSLFNGIPPSEKKKNFILKRGEKILAKRDMGTLFSKKIKKMGKKACAFMKILFINVFF